MAGTSQGTSGQPLLVRPTLDDSHRYRSMTGGCANQERRPEMLSTSTDSIWTENLRGIHHPLDVTQDNLLLLVLVLQDVH